MAAVDGSAGTAERLTLPTVRKGTIRWSRTRRESIKGAIIHAMGEWIVIECEICGFRSGARTFVENALNCPRCATKANLPRVATQTWRTAALVVALLSLIMFVARVIVLQL